jgi:hypothetical protein
MAFAVTKFMAYGVQIESPVKRRTVQRAVLTITGANSDVAWDLGTLAGTFWTSAIAHATYADVAKAALAMLTTIGANALSFDRVGGEILNTYWCAAAASGNAYTMTIANGLPIITLETAHAPTSTVLILEWEMNPDVVAQYADIG